MRDYDWLNNLKPGDEVVHCSGTYGKSLSKVERTTATQIVLAGGGKYRKSNGNAVGDNGWMPQYICKPTPELRDEIHKKILCDKLRRVVWEKIKTDTLAEIFEKVKSGQHLS